MIFTSGRNDHEGNIYRIVSGALMKSLLHDTAGGGTLRYYLIASRCLTNDFAPLTKPPSWNRSQREFHSPRVLRHNVSGLEINFFASFQAIKFFDLKWATILNFPSHQMTIINITNE